MFHLDFKILRDKKKKWQQKFIENTFSENAQGMVKIQLNFPHLHPQLSVINIDVVDDSMKLPKLNQWTHIAHECTIHTRGNISVSSTKQLLNLTATNSQSRNLQTLLSQCLLHCIQLCICFLIFLLLESSLYFKAFPLQFLA